MLMINASRLLSHERCTKGCKACFVAGTHREIPPERAESESMSLSEFFAVISTKGKGIPNVSEIYAGEKAGAAHRQRGEWVHGERIAKCDHSRLGERDVRFQQSQDIAEISLLALRDGLREESPKEEEVLGVFSHGA